jgi:uncharacterized membrane protein
MNRISKSSLEDVAERISDVDALDGPATLLTEFSARQRGPVAELARGEPLGHRLHPLLTDLPIGFWTSAFVLDVAGGRRSAGAARTLVGLGVVTAVPTVVAGIADLPLLSDRKRRVAVVHAASNAVATLLYAKSWIARQRGHRLGGIVIGLIAIAVATVGGFLGGWLAFGREPGEQAADIGIASVADAEAI